MPTAITITDLINTGESFITKYPDINDLSILYDVDYYKWIEDGLYFIDNASISYQGDVITMVEDAYTGYKTNRQSISIILGFLKHIEPYIEETNNNAEET